MFTGLTNLFSRIENIQDSTRIFKSWVMWVILAILNKVVCVVSNFLLAAKGPLVIKLILGLLGTLLSLISIGTTWLADLSFLVAMSFTFIGGTLNLLWYGFMVWGKWSGNLDYNGIPDPPPVLDLVGSSIAIIIAVMAKLSGFSPKEAAFGTVRGLQDRWFLAGIGGRVIMVLIGLVILAILIGLIILFIKIVKSRKGGPGPRMGNRVP